jgi:tight adherence protein C
MLPDIKYSERLRKRRESIRRAFIPFLDLMVLILESGVDFMGSLNFLRGRFPEGDLTREIEKMLLEIRLGSTREKALLRFAARTGEKDIEDFISAVATSGKSGNSLAMALKNLSASAKTLRIQRAEKAAHEAPVKLLAPLVVFIFPVVFIILFGPIIIGFIK